MGNQQSTITILEQSKNVVSLRQTDIHIDPEWITEQLPMMEALELKRVNFRISMLILLKVSAKPNCRLYISENTRFV